MKGILCCPKCSSFQICGFEVVALNPCFGDFIQASRAMTCSPLRLSYCRSHLLLQCLDTLPSAAQPLFPQADPVVASADCQHIPTQTPTHAPRDRIDIECG